MSQKPKPSTSAKKTSSQNAKESIQQTVAINEILKVVISRSEDIAVLKSLSDRKTGKLRVQSLYAEKNISEVEFKEDWRYSKEENCLYQIINSTTETQMQRKTLEKATRKMIRLNMQLEEDPSENDYNLSEIHVAKVMSVRICQENTMISFKENGMTQVNLPSLIINSATFKENYSSLMKITEGCLYGEVLKTYNCLFLCVRHSRELYLEELSRQKSAIEEGLSLLSPNIAVVITKKRSKSTICPQKKMIAQLKKPLPLPEPDFKSSLLKMMLEANTEAEKSIKAFAVSFFDRNAEDKPRVLKSRDPILKALRARDYEKFSAVNPWAAMQNIFKLSNVKTLKSLHMQPEVLFDLENTYFDENLNLADRIKVIHSCLTIQNTYRFLRKKFIERKVILIQKYFRGYMARLRVVLMRTTVFRKMFYWERLRHWYGLLVNKFREKKSKISESKFIGYERQIVLIQKNIRGYLARKGLVYWKKVFFCVREKKNAERAYRSKQRMWRISLEFEDQALDVGNKVKESGFYNEPTNIDRFFSQARLQRIQSFS